MSGFGGGLLIVALLFVWGYGGAFALRYGVPAIGHAALWLLRCFGLTLRVAGRVLSAALFRRTDIDPCDESAEDEDEYTAFSDEDADRAAYEAARMLLGLPESFTEQDLTRAYRRMIAGALPDRGGSHDLALAVNAARDIIRRVRFSGAS